MNGIILALINATKIPVKIVVCEHYRYKKETRFQTPESKMLYLTWCFIMYNGGSCLKAVAKFLRTPDPTTIHIMIYNQISDYHKVIHIAH